MGNISKYTNNTGIGLSMAVYLATDNYDHNHDPRTISATTLIKSTKQIILGERVRIAESAPLPDLSSKIKSQGGTALHTAVEEAWLKNYRGAMVDLGYPDKVIDKMLINPTPEELKARPDAIPVYMEIRSFKIVNGWTVTGKFDFVIEGKLEDIKRTGTFTFVNKTNDNKYIQQGSIYKWLNPDIITGDFITIQFDFTDWKAYEQQRNPTNYPKHPMLGYRLPLATISQTQTFVETKTAELNKFWDSPESDMPACTKEDLWMKDSTYKYYKNPTKMGKSTKNFIGKNASGEAYGRLAADGNVGVVVEIKPAATACGYCSAYSLCKQKDNYIIK